MCCDCGPHEHGGAGAECCGAGEALRGFLQPRLVLLLLEKPAHGYELMERLAEHVDEPGVEPGPLYRTLRQLEADGLLRSTWDTDRAGPARRRYQVTPEGVDFLHAWAVRVQRTRERLGEFLERYQACCDEQEKE